MASYIYILYFLSLLFFVFSKKELKVLKRDLYTIKVKDFVFWPNATVPFYINPQHFDKEQSMAIMSTLAMYAFKTCLQFNPVMAEPALNQHVLSFENAGGVRKCVIGVEGHAKEEPHRIILGYDCLKPPQIDMLLMKALGFPFEHNRASRDVYIDVQFENIEMGSIALFTKEKILPTELRALPYDVDSVMHFGERDFSKNGHRTIIFKSDKTVQNRIGLSKFDLRKIDIVYGPECLKRERQAKIDICKSYPVRKKRDIDLATVKSLRVNPDITPPPDVVDQKNLTDEVMDNLKELGIENEVQELIDQIHKITATALLNAKSKHCNSTSDNKYNHTKLDDNAKSPDLTDIINTVDRYLTSVVENAVVNLTIFCNSSNSVEMFQRVRCSWGRNKRCPIYYKSTKPGPPRYSTQHRPIMGQSTKHERTYKKRQYVNFLRSRKDAEETSNLTRRKRDLQTNVSNVTKLIELTTDTNPDDVKNLRRVTKLFSDKKVNYVPLRKNFRESASRNEDNGDGSDISQERQRKKKIKSQLHRPKQEIIKIKFKSNEEDKSSDKIKDYSDNEEVEERKIDKKDKKKRIRKEKISFRTPQTVKLTKENRDFYRERMWLDGIVKYVIQENSKHDTQKVRARLAAVNKILKRKTCVRLQEISADTENDTDYLVLDTSRDYVTGRVGGKQNFGSLELFEGGQHRQHAAMMVMAMLGFYFEVSRHDRDKYIRIHNRHIRPDKLHHFEKIRSEATLALPYDYTSATHPAWQFWRKIGKTGISTVATYKDKDPDGSTMKSLGQNAQLLSDTDIIKINSVYGVKCFQNQRRMKIRRTRTGT